jgi:hypothetical protein
MVRVVRPGGLIASYAWDTTRGGVPLEAIWDEMARMGASPARPPSENASRIKVLRELWTGAGLNAVETMEIVVQRTFENFEDYWTTTIGISIGAQIAEMPYADRGERTES